MRAQSLIGLNVKREGGSKSERNKFYTYQNKRKTNKIRNNSNNNMNIRNYLIESSKRKVKGVIHKSDDQEHKSPPPLQVPEVNRFLTIEENEFTTEKPTEEDRSEAKFCQENGQKNLQKFHRSRN